MNLKLKFISVIKIVRLGTQAHVIKGMVQVKGHMTRFKILVVYDCQKGGKNKNGQNIK